MAISNIGSWEKLNKKELVEMCIYFDKELDDALIEIACFKDELVELDNLREFKYNWENRDGL
jgi:hypothetical protein